MGPDRVFRALAREQPESIVRLLGVVAPEVVATEAPITPEAVDDPNLDPPPPFEADWIARVGEEDVVHVECQGYTETGFADRLFRYHLALVLRYPRRRVHTVAIWVIRPPASQRERVIEREHVRVSVTPVVLSEVEAERLLADPITACFAAGARFPSEAAVEETCSRIAKSLARHRASNRERVMTLALATTAGRYHAMVSSMKRERVEPLFVEDFVRFGRDEGQLEMARRALMVVLEARGFTVTDTDRARIEAELSAETLLEWQRRAVTAASVAEALA